MTGGERAILSQASQWEADQIDYVIGLFGYVRAGLVAPVTPTLASVLGREPITFEQFARDYAGMWR